jgi:hypothetical protein
MNGDDPLEKSERPTPLRRHAARRSRTSWQLIEMSGRSAVSSSWSRRLLYELGVKACHSTIRF